jgi:hypothetical protein
MGGLNGAGDYHGYEAILALKARLKNECGKSPRIEDLLALDDKNDPFYAGAPAQRARAKWFAQVWHGFGRARSHLRAVHYWLVTQPDSRRHDGSPYENTVKHWKYLDECSKYARYLGLVDAEAIEDHRNPEHEIYAELPLFTEEPRVILESLDKWSLPAIESDLAGMIELPLPGIADVEGYEYRPIDEPYFIELWIEKSTMDYLLRPICRALHVNFVPSVGFQSIGSAVKLLKRVQALGRVCQSGKPVRIFHIADFDPAGSHMAAAIARQVEFWLHRYAPEADIKLTSLALTHDQVVTYRLPRKMLQESDTRKRGFEERFGEGACELDALEALRPGELGRLVRAAIAPYRDPTLRDRLHDAADEAQELAEEAWDERLAPLREERDAIERDVRRLIADYTEDLQRLKDRLQEDMAPLEERAARLRQVVRDERERFTREVVLPERPEAETDAIDEEGWLYSSDRDYLTQLARYKARKNGQASDEPTC